MLFPMTLEPHPHIKFVTVEVETLADGSLQIVSVVHTDLELSNARPGYTSLRRAAAGGQR